MASPHTHPDRHSPRWLVRYDVRLSFVVAACLLVEAVILNEVLDVSLDYFSQLAALWVFIAESLTGRHDKATARAFRFAAVAMTAAVLGLYPVCECARVRVASRRGRARQGRNPCDPPGAQSASAGWSLHVPLPVSLARLSRARETRPDDPPVVPLSG